MSWQRNTNERSVLYECPRCKVLTSIIVGRTGACSKCGLTLAVDSDIAKNNEKAAFVKRSCNPPKLKVAVNFNKKGMRHGRGD